MECLQEYVSHIKYNRTVFAFIGSYILWGDPSNFKILLPCQSLKTIEVYMQEQNLMPNLRQL
jgi:hypothetical protein